MYCFQTLTGQSLDPVSLGFASIDAFILHLGDIVEMRYVGNRTTHIFVVDNGEPVGTDMLLATALPLHVS